MSVSDQVMVIVVVTFSLYGTDALTQHRMPPLLSPVATYRRNLCHIADKTGLEYNPNTKSHMHRRVVLRHVMVHCNRSI